MIGRADGVPGIDQRGERGPGGVVPFTGGGFPSGVLRRGDDFEILIAELGVEFLPPWQIESAASPTGPGDNQGFLAAKIGEMHDAALAVGNREIGGYA